MVSQSSSVGYTIMGRLLTWQLSKRRPLTPCTRRADTKGHCKRGWLFTELCPSTLIERRREGKDVVEKKCTSNRDNRTLERIVKQNPFKNVGEIHKEWTAAGPRTTTHRRMQDMVSAVAFLVSSHSWTTDSVRSVSPGLKTKRTGLLLSGPKLCSLMKVNFAFPLEIRVPESGGREERHRIHVAWGPV